MNCAHFRLVTGGGIIPSSRFYGGECFSLENIDSHFGFWRSHKGLYKFVPLYIASGERWGWPPPGWAARSAAPKRAKKMLDFFGSIQPAHIFGQFNPHSFYANRKRPLRGNLESSPGSQTRPEAGGPDFYALSIQPAHIPFDPHTFMSTRTGCVCAGLNDTCAG